MDVDIFKSKIECLVLDIAQNNFVKIERQKENGRVSIDDLKRVIKDYNCEIMPLPPNAFDYADIYFIENENRLDVYIPLWTKEEGRSDLTLIISCYVRLKNVLIEINDLLVL